MPNRKYCYSDLEKYKSTRNKQRKKYYDKTAIYPYKHWTEEEIDMVMNSDKTDMELSNLLKRSVNSIQKKRFIIKSQMKSGD